MMSHFDVVVDPMAFTSSEKETVHSRKRSVSMVITTVGERPQQHRRSEVMKALMMVRDAWFLLVLFFREGGGRGVRYGKVEK